MSKYVDLAAQIIRDRMRGPITGMGGEAYTLTWLDENPDQVPGRTITESEFREAYSALGDMDGPDCYRSLLDLLGITVVPDPEPTNAEKLAQDLMQADRDGGEAYRYGYHELAEYLAERGWTKAPTDD